MARRGVPQGTKCRASDEGLEKVRDPSDDGAEPKIWRERRVKRAEVSVKIWPVLCAGPNCALRTVHLGTSRPKCFGMSRRRGWEPR